MIWFEATLISERERTMLCVNTMSVSLWLIQVPNIGVGYMQRI